MPLLEAPSCRPSVLPKPSAARIPWLILWLPFTGDWCRERQNSIFVLEYRSSRAWFLYGSYYQVSNWKTSAVRSRISSKLIYACWVGYFDLIWSKTRMRCGFMYYHSTVSYWGASWSKVLVLIWYRMYVREDCYFWFFIETRISFF